MVLVSFHSISFYIFLFVFSASTAIAVVAALALLCMHGAVSLGVSVCVMGMKFSKYWSVKYFNLLSFRQLYGLQRRSCEILLHVSAHEYVFTANMCCVFILKGEFSICSAACEIYGWSIKLPDALLQSKNSVEKIGDSVLIASTQSCQKWICTGMRHASALHLLTCIWHAFQYENEELLENNSTCKIPCKPLHLLGHFFACIPALHNMNEYSNVCIFQLLRPVVFCHFCKHLHLLHIIVCVCSIYIERQLGD